MKELMLLEKIITKIRENATFTPEVAKEFEHLQNFSDGEFSAYTNVLEIIKTFIENERDFAKDSHE